jgi:putative ABC transport system substrate-binding protein
MFCKLAIAAAATTLLSATSAFAHHPGGANAAKLGRSSHCRDDDGGWPCLSRVLLRIHPSVREAVPQATRISVLFSPTAPSHRPALQALETAGQTLGVQLQLVPVRTVEDFDGAFAMMAREDVGGCLVVAAPIFFSHRARVAELALKHLLPATFGGREYVEAGGFMTYSGDLNDLVRRAAAYIDKILKGAKPADLPVEQASKYELVTTSRPLRRSASKCRRCCSAAPTR